MAQPEAGRVLYAINSRMVSGRNITRPPTLTRAIFLRWIQFRSVHWEMPRIFAAWGTLSRGSITSSKGAGAGCAGRGSVAMVFSLRDFVWPRAAFSTAMWHAWSQGQESAAGLVRTALCTSEGDFRQTRSLTRVEASIRLSVGDRNRLQRRALNLGAANQGVDHRVPHSKCIRRRKIPKSKKLRPRNGQGRELRAQYNCAIWPIALRA